MITDNETLKSAAQIAEFRFGIVAPALQGLFPDASKTAYFKRICQKPFTLPDGSTAIYSYKTLEDWAVKYKHGGLDALLPRERNDKGSSRALPDTAIEEIFRLKKEFPRLNATQIHSKLISDSFIPASVSVDSVQRFIKKNDLKQGQVSEARDRKAFEEDAFGRMWQADTCYIAHIKEGGVSRQVYCIAIIDDHSRMIVGARMFYHDNACNFQMVLKDAIATYSIPEKLMVDNGCSFSNEQLSMICVSAGIRLIHNRPRDAAAKAKIERAWLTMKTRFIYTLKLDTITSLDQFNDLLTEYVRSYNTTHHTGIDDTPMNRFLASSAEVRKPVSREWLDDCFYNRIFRKVRKDSTVSVNCISYDVPMQFIDMQVELRYRPDDPEHPFLLYENVKYPIRKTNKVENCHTKRNNPPALDYSRLRKENF